MVVDERLGVVKLVPEDIGVPPVWAVYQFSVPPAQPVAESVTVPVPHLLPLVAVGGGTLHVLMQEIAATQPGLTTDPSDINRIVKQPSAEDDVIIPGPTVPE